jgi:hypothetical protein
MLSGNQNDRGTGRSQTADWWDWLGNDPRLTPGLRESCRRTLAGFEPFCLRRRASVVSPNCLDTSQAAEFAMGRRQMNRRDATSAEVLASAVISALQ